MGERVEVWAGSGDKFLGKGEVVGVADVYVFSLPNHDLLTMTDCEVVPPPDVIQRYLEFGAALRLIRDNPKIQLEDGTFTYGCNCWWRPIDESTEPKENPPA